jgi:hypothetical protein
MRVRLLRAVMLCGAHTDEGAEVSLDDDLASSLYDRGHVDLLDDAPEAEPTGSAALASEDTSPPALATASAAASQPARKRR